MRPRANVLNVSGYEPDAAMLASGQYEVTT
jgi:hypothetical protein